MRRDGSNRFALATMLGLGIAAAAGAGERTERFDRDPNWEGRNNRSTHFAARPVRQDFGFSPTHQAGGRAAGEMGGVLTPAAEPASCGKILPNRTLDDRLTASGVLACGEGKVHALVGFYNAGTLNEWRTPNTIALRIQGRGDHFEAYVEYATSRWRAGGDEPRPFARVRDPETGRSRPKGFAARGTTHRWTLEYDPKANDGLGAVTATIDDQTAVCHLLPGHKADGATFNRFGLLNIMKSVDDPGTLWLDDVAVEGVTEAFDADPAWDGRGNRRSYASENVRPRFDFGFSPTAFAGGQGRGELGGLVFRGDCRSPERLGAYGDRVGPLTLDRPLRASGRVALRRGVTDSTTLLGFYHAERSLASNPSQDSGWPAGFLGLAVEGPSREGFLVYPAFRTLGDRQGSAGGDDRPHILPDGRPHSWSFAYDPAGAGGLGRIALTFDEQTARLDLAAGDKAFGASFDRFGLVTTWIDGNGQQIYFDDLTYTATQAAAEE